MADAYPKTLWDQAYNRGGVKLPKAVLNALRTWANPHTLECHATIEELAEWTGLSPSACWRQLNANEAAGWVEVVHQGHSGGKANVYRLRNPGENATVSQVGEDANCGVYAMNRGENATETVAKTPNLKENKETPRGVSKGKENRSENATVPQGGHSAGNSPRGQSASRSLDDLSANTPNPEGVKVQGDYNRRVNATVPFASTQPEPQSCSDPDNCPDPFCSCKDAGRWPDPFAGAYPGGFTTQEGDT